MFILFPLSSQEQRGKEEGESPKGRDWDAFQHNGKNSITPDDGGGSLGEDGTGTITGCTKESRGDETARSKEKGLDRN